MVDLWEIQKYVCKKNNNNKIKAVVSHQFMRVFSAVLCLSKRLWGSSPFGKVFTSAFNLSEGLWITQKPAL